MSGQYGINFDGVCLRITPAGTNKTYMITSGNVEVIECEHSPQPAEIVEAHTEAKKRGRPFGAGDKSNA